MQKHLSNALLGQSRVAVIGTVIGAEASDEEKALWRVCPMRCRRCADMSAGEFLQQVHDSLDASSSRIALDLPSTPLGR